MTVRRPPAELALVGALVLSVLPLTVASATSALRVTSTVATTLSSSMPVVRLHFSQPVAAKALPALSLRPALSTAWQQIAPNEVQAVVTGSLKPLLRYTVVTPTVVSCSSTCVFVKTTPHVTSSTTNVLWEEQLLAQLHYLPLSFTPAVASSDPAAAVPGTFSWSFPNLPTTLSSQWRLGAANVLVTGALMAFQNNHNLPTSGNADAPTWNALVAAVEQNNVNPSTYNYVDVSEASPEHLTLYVNGVEKFHTIVNTGISVDPTQLGTYPVYLRYQSQIMRGTNPDGSKYADPVSWVSYFYGGDALHQFYRASYGWPQSLGCVEMAMNDAKFVWPFTPIGTLVTVRPA